MGDPLRIAFETANSEGRAALVIYLPAGYPDLSTSLACMRAAAESGADLIEVGFPFSDPMMDGPIIQAANQTVLDAGVTLDDQLALCADLTATLPIPVAVMTYYTIPDARGLAQFADDAVEAGLAGAILPDLPASESGPWVTEAKRAGLSTVFLAAPVTTTERLGALAEASTGFLYASSLMGVTGVRDTVADARDLVTRIRGVTELPVGVGIGVSTAEQAMDVASYADGVIVGSAVVRAVGEGGHGTAPERVGHLVQALRAGVERRS